MPGPEEPFRGQAAEVARKIGRAEAALLTAARAAAGDELIHGRLPTGRPARSAAGTPKARR